ncbi:hypothetical protein CSW12_29665 (plasmid) [Bacillus cereus]|nr:hypothetical protein CSW12_29665 [Bacillus cereus]
MSELDIAYFYTLEWDDNVIDIRENFPLDQELLTKIVESYDINTRKQLPLFITTSFLITMKSDDIVARWGMATKSEIWGHMQIYSNSKRVCEEVFIRHIPFLLIGYLVNWHIEL